jgi:hypothetical protein
MNTASEAPLRYGLSELYVGGAGGEVALLEQIEIP